MKNNSFIYLVIFTIPFICGLFIVFLAYGFLFEGQHKSQKVLIDRCYKIQYVRCEKDSCDAYILKKGIYKKVILEDVAKHGDLICLKEVL